MVMVAAGTVQAEDWSPIWTTATLSKARYFLSATSAGNKVLFAGGCGSSKETNAVDIYDAASGTWSTATLSQARFHLSAASAGGKAFFAGGYYADGARSSVVDIYDAASNSWSTATLPHARYCLAAASAAGKVFFAGGFGDEGETDVVDIYDTASGAWSTATLSQARWGLSAAAVGTKIYFAGGKPTEYTKSDRVDIYDTVAGTWSTATLSQARSTPAAASAGDKVVFGGGYRYESYDVASSVADIFTATTGTRSTAALTEARSLLSAASAGDKILFAGGAGPTNASGSTVDVYDTTQETWSTATLSQPRSGLAAASVGDRAFFGGGYWDSYSSVVDIYHYMSQNYGTITSSKVFTLQDHATVAGLMHLTAPGSLSLATYSLTVGSMSGDAPINLGSSTLTVGSDNTPIATYSGVISGSGRMVKTGTGTLVLAGNNTYSGATDFNGGVIQASALANLGVGGALNFNGGGLQWAPSATFDPSVRTMTFTGGATFDIGGNTVTLANAIGNNGPGGLTKSGSGTLILRGPAAYSGGTTINAGRLSAGSGSTLSGNLAVAASAQFENSGGNVHLANLSNGGTFLGNARISGTFSNQSTGSVRIAAGQTVFIDGTTATHTNVGLIEVISNPNVLGGQAEFTCLGPLTNAAGTGLITGKNAMLRFEGGLTNQGSIGLSYGNNDVYGKINNTGRIAIGGNTAVTFYDDLVQNGTLTVSAAGSTRASAVFFGAVTGSGGFAGGGDVMLLGDLRPGNSPGNVVFDANVYLSPSTTTVMELGGLSPGTQYDRIDVGGSLSLGGTLDVVLIGNFAPSPGDRFDLLDGNVSGTFDAVALPPLGPGLSWDASNLYTSGTITVVPEPGTLVLLLMGAAGVLAWIAGFRRGRIARA
jgi:autotransporter-associated beta strand protein